MLSDESFAQQKMYQRSEALWKLVNHFNENQKVYQPQQFLKEVIQHPKLIWYPSIEQQSVKKRLISSSAADFVVYSYASLVPQEIRDVLHSFKGEVTVLTREPPEVRIDGAHVISLLFRCHCLSSMNPLYGSICLMAGKNEAFMAARIESKLGAEQLLRSIDVYRKIKQEIKKRKCI